MRIFVYYKEKSAVILYYCKDIIVNFKKNFTFTIISNITLDKSNVASSAQSMFVVVILKLGLCSKIIIKTFTDM